MSVSALHTEYTRCLDDLVCREHLQRLLLKQRPGTKQAGSLVLEIPQTLGADLDLQDLLSPEQMDETVPGDNWRIEVPLQELPGEMQVLLEPILHYFLDVISARLQSQVPRVQQALAIAAGGLGHADNAPSGVQHHPDHAAPDAPPG